MVLTKAEPAQGWEPLPGAQGARQARWFECDEPRLAKWQTAAGVVAAFSGRAPAKTGPNEDALAVVQANDGSVVLVVADGMGGQAAGEAAARQAVDAVCDSVIAAGDDTDRLRSAIVDGIEEANRAVLALANGAGATLAVVLVSEPFIRSFHVGDSSILLMGQRGRVKFETIAHSPVGYAEASGLLDPTDAMQHEERHIVSNFVGDGQMRIEIGPVLPMAQYDTLLLATDGLSDNMLSGELVAALRAGPLGRCGEQLVSLAMRRMTDPTRDAPCKPDDLTFLAFRRR